MSLPKLLTKKEASQALRCSLRTVDTLISEGKIQGVIKSGRLVLIPEESILKYLSRHTLKVS